MRWLMTRGKEPKPNRRTRSPSSEKAGKPPSLRGVYTYSDGGCLGKGVHREIPENFLDQTQDEPSASHLTALTNYGPVMGTTVGWLWARCSEGRGSPHLSTS